MTGLQQPETGAWPIWPAPVTVTVASPMAHRRPGQVVTRITRASPCPPPPHRPAAPTPPPRRRSSNARCSRIRAPDAPTGWPIEIARPISDQGWGLLTAISLPGGMELGLYQPRHPTAAQPT